MLWVYRIIWLALKWTTAFGLQAQWLSSCVVSLYVLLLAVVLATARVYKVTNSIESTSWP